jgi:membrane protein implicated in regulation of membrane protease activity
MAAVWELFVTHAFWAWIGLGALLLAVEVALGSGYLLWPAAAAVVVALATLTGAGAALPVQLSLFAVLTIAATLASRRFFRPEARTGPDINDPLTRLVGHHGHAAGDFHGGQGRVFIDGKEWSAEADEALKDGDRVEVTSVKSGAALRVRAA